MTEVEREAVRLTAMILAAEEWPKLYSKTPDQHAELIKATANLTVSLTKFFKSMAKKSGDFINWQHYNYQLNQTKQATLDRVALAYNVDVIINDEQIDSWDTPFIQVAYKPVANSIVAGAASAQTIYGRTPKVPMQSTSSIIQDLTTQHVAALVGKKVLKDGSIVDNPNAAYDITDTMREDIASSIKKSLALGLTSDEAAAEIEDIVGDPYRAERIANTEAVNAYNSGVKEYGDQTDAVGKEWEDAGADDECASNSDQGPIPFDDDFDSGDDAPPAHPNCRCALRLVYSNEMDAANDDITFDE